MALDPQLVTLAKAIRQQESGGDPTRQGGSGEYGAYQFMPSTWASYAKYAGVNVPLQQATLQQQNEVAYKALERMRKEHPDWNVGNFASAWNAGEAKPNAYKEQVVGTNAKGVHYDTPGYAKAVAQYYQQFKGQGQSPETPQVPAAPAPRFQASGALGAVQNVAQGAAKAGTRSFLGLGHLGQQIPGVVGKGLDAVTGGKLHFADDAKQGIFSPTSPQGIAARQGLEATNTAQKIGGGIEKVAEYALPGGVASKGEKALDFATQNLPSLLGAGARVLGKSALQGVAAGGTELATSGGDTKKALGTAATAGVLRGALAVGGEAARGAKIPERLYQMVFKNSKNDMFSELNANGLVAFQKNDPKAYQSLVDQGIIRVGKNGKAAVNDTLAEKALDRGLRGSIKNMANEVVRGKYESEAAVRHIASTYKGVVSLPEQQFQGVLQDIAKEYEGVGFGEVSKQAQALEQTLKSSGGNVSAEDALALRRFLDKLRVTSSYDKPVFKLSTSQANLKTLADTVRKRLNAVPGMKGAMDEYSFHIEALDALAQEAKRTGNNQVMGLIDSIFLGEGLAGSPALPLTAGILRRIVNSASGSTRLGHAIGNPSLGGRASALLQSGSSFLQSARTSQ